MTGRAFAREITRFAKRLPSQGHLLYLGPAGAERLNIVHRSLGANWQVETRPVPPHGEVEWSNLPETSYDAVLMIGVLEQVNNPLAALKLVARLLRPGGLVLVVTPYTQSSAGNVFRGRHWSGYSFPRHPNLFDGKSLGRAAGLAGLELVTVRTAPAPRAWLESARNLMADWEAPAWIVTASGNPHFRCVPRLQLSSGCNRFRVREACWWPLSSAPDDEHTPATGGRGRSRPRGIDRRSRAPSARGSSRGI